MPRMPRTSQVRILRLQVPETSPKEQRQGVVWKLSPPCVDSICALGFGGAGPMRLGGPGSPCRVKPTLAVCLLARIMVLGGVAASAQICAC